jgi:xylulokinase
VGPGADLSPAAVAVGGQQHGMVVSDAAGAVLRPAKLWNDTESAPDAGWLLAQLATRDADGTVVDDGSAAWADAVGSVPVAAFTVTKLSWLHRSHPDAWTRLTRVLLPHDYLTHRLTGAYTTDRGDASGTGYWSASTGEYRWDVLSIIDGGRDWSDSVPSVLGPLEVAGDWNGVTVAVGTGDNMAAALGLGLGVGDAAVSIGTSGTAFTVSEHPTSDPSGAVAGFADATGRFLPLVCTSNAAKVLDAVARLLGVDHEEFDRLALAATGDVPVLLPYFDGERTPNRPGASGLMSGLRSDVTREQFARAAVNGVACGLLDALDALRLHAPVSGGVVLTGGGARSRALQAVIAGALGGDVAVTVAGVEQAVATGAAVQAAATFEGVDHRTIQHRWGLGGGRPVDSDVAPGDLRERYAELRDCASDG